MNIRKRPGLASYAKSKIKPMEGGLQINRYSDPSYCRKKYVLAFFIYLWKPGCRERINVGNELITNQLRSYIQKGASTTYVYINIKHSLLV